VHVDELWQARVIFEKDLPQPALEAFDFTTKAPVGQLVLIPAKKYPAFAEKDAGGKSGFKGWAGKLMAFEKSQTKMRVKIQNDSGYEHMSVKGTSAYALQNLVRLVCDVRSAAHAAACIISSRLFIESIAVYLICTSPINTEIWIMEITH